MAAAGAASAECKIGIQVEMPVHMERNEPLMTGQINGHDIEIMADLGANKSLLFRSAMARLGLHAFVVDNSSFYGVDGPTKAYTTTLDTMTLGTLKARNLSLFVVGSEAASPGPVVGLLGADFFSQSDVEFDLGHNAIRFLKATGCKEDEVLYWGGAYSTLALAGARDGDNGLYVEVKLNGQPVLAQLDTGAGLTIVNTSTARRVGAELRAPDGNKGYLVGIASNRLQLSTARLKTIQLDQETLHNVDIGAADIMSRNVEHNLGSRIATPIESTTDSLILGADFFMSHRILISRSQHRIYFTYNGGSIFGPAASSPPPAK